MKWILWCIAIVAVFSCTNETAGESSSIDTAGAHAGASNTGTLSTIALRDGCYEMVMKRDTATLQISLQDSLVTGSLDYRWHEKDHNTGTIKGYLRDSLIVADYTFESEGMTSVREVIFKLEGDTLLQGFGNLKEENGKIIFTDRNTLQFTNANPFFRVKCRQDTAGQ